MENNFIPPFISHVLRVAREDSDGTATARVRGLRSLCEWVNHWMMTFLLMSFVDALAVNRIRSNPVFKFTQTQLSISVAVE
jgi:hypothetical protein